MRKALFFGLLWLLFLAAVSPVWRAEGAFDAASGATRPNFVFILADDMRWDEVENMPNVLALASQGVRFTQAFVPNSLCCPSRSTTLTGQFSSRNGVWTNASPSGGFNAFKPHEAQTVAVWLRNAGYYTGLVGKYLNQYSSKSAKTAADPSGLKPRPGWDAWHAFINDTSGSEPPAYYGYSLDDDGKSQYHGSTTADYSTNVLGSKAVDFVRTAPADRPYFLYFTPYGPHSPFTPAPGDSLALPKCAAGDSPPSCYKPITLAAPGLCPAQTGLPPYCSENIGEKDVSDKPAWVRALTATGTGWDSKRKMQEQTLLSVDRQVGALVAAVASRGDLANTMFVFTSDNGLSGGSHRWTAKETAWEEAIQVPMIVRFDPVTEARAGGIDGSHMILNADLAPTLLRLAGATPPPGYVFDGQSWDELLGGGPSGWRTAFPLEHLQYGGNPPTYCGVRTDGAPSAPGRWKYIRYANGETELYDLISDPFELRNAAETPGYGGVKASLDTLTRQLCNPAPPGYTWG